VKISLDWLTDYVKWEGDVAELAHRLTMSGLNVEQVEEFAITFPGVVVARVLTCGRHPDADKLSLCTVDDGTGDPVQVVCGAPNVRAGLMVLFARVGAVLPGGLKIKKTKIRGVESRGMICSATELELGDAADGIMELETESPPGTPADELFGYRDTVLDIEVTPNRPDWLSHLGVAREVAALYDLLLETPETWSPPKGGGERIDFTVEVADFRDCPRYTAHAARDLRVGPSPRWLQNRLRAVGSRPINNVVDITNYVLLETGQPLHAFDMQRLRGNRIQVRRAEPGTSFAALDGSVLELSGDDLVIADNGGPVALAGVMGGADSEVTSSTTEVLLESAFFQPGLVRRTARRHQLTTESSYRFERGADWEMVEFAARRALHLMQELAGAHIVTEFIDRQDPDRKEQEPLTLRIDQVQRLLGDEVTLTEAVEVLQSIGLKCQPLGQASERDHGRAKLMVTVPSFRRDLTDEVDLIEEVARVRGYDRVSPSPRPPQGVPEPPSPRERLVTNLQRQLTAVGFHEIVTSSFTSRRAVLDLGLAGDDPRLEMLAVDNPHHGGETLLRTTLTPALLAALRHNLNADAPVPIRLFQVGKAFLPALSGREGRHPDEKLLPHETLTFQCAVAGRRDTAWGDLPGGVAELRGLVDQLAERLRLPLQAEPADTQPYLQAGLQWRLQVGEKTVGAIGAVAGAVLRRYEIDEPVALLEWELLETPLEPEPLSYRPFPRHPAAKRDLSLLVPPGVVYGDVMAVIEEAAGPLLAHAELFDHYQGDPLPEGRTALGIRLKFQSAKGTLKGKAVDRAVAQITQRLADRLGVTLRS